jgi:4-hydroxybenzoate polyprenyltransferase
MQAGLRRGALKVQEPLVPQERIQGRTSKFKQARSLAKELRPQQWVKNLFVLAPLLFSQNLFTPAAVGRALTAFVLFCLASSSVYLLNDIRDREQDRLHPRKRHRPLASGELNVSLAAGVMIALLLSALAGAWMISKPLALMLFGYWLINLLYSTWLKHQVILDVFAIASGFVLRVAGGGLAIEVEISHWLLLCTTLLALFLGFSKRRHELGLLKAGAQAHRVVLADYNPGFLDMMIAIVTASTVMSYALYTVSEDTMRRFHTHALMLTLPFVLYGIFRYLYLIHHKNEGGDPTQSLLTDIPMLVNVFLWALTAGVIVYWR